MLKCCFLVNTKKKPSYFTPFSSASIVDFEQVNVWVTVNRGPFQKNSSMHTERLWMFLKKNHPYDKEAENINVLIFT